MIHKLKFLISVTVLIFLYPIAAEAHNGAYHASEPKLNILSDMLGGQTDDVLKAVKWKPSKGDAHEFNSLYAEDALYTFIDTIFEITHEKTFTFYVIFHTAPMEFNEESQFVNPNNCHVCGVNLGYFSFNVESDSIYINEFRRNFATHGSFGNKTYSLSFINLGDGYEFLKVDDPYEGMGTQSVATVFYREGDRVLSMISKENNKGNRKKNEKGYYEFTTVFTYDKAKHNVRARQTEFKIDEKTGKKISTITGRTFSINADTWQF